MDYLEMRNEIIGYDALYESMTRCRKGVSWKSSVLHYTLNGLEETYRLCEELEKGTYRARPATKFTITSPKKREIISICYRDRVYQRSLNDNALYPIMTRSFIRDNWACQRGRGTDDARKRVKVFTQRMYRKHGTDFYVLQCDIHGYYPNMRHDVTNRMLEAKLDHETCRRSREVLDGQYSGDTGYNPGSQMVQIVGISALDTLDHYISEVLRPEAYGRYMDDFLLFHPKREYLETCMDEIERKLREKGMTFNPEKTRIIHIRDGFLYLGFRYRITDTGKVIMTVNPENVKAERRKLRRMVRKAKRGEMTREKVDECYKSWKNHATKGNSYKLLRRMDDFYKELWR